MIQFGRVKCQDVAQDFFVEKRSLKCNAPKKSKEHIKVMVVTIAWVVV